MQHIASEQALQAASRELLSTAATLDEGALSTLAAELASVTRLLRREVALRRTLSETTTSVDTRAGIMSRLLTGQVSDPARHMVDVVVRQNWATGVDLRDGLNRLSRIALFLRAERTGELDEVEDELFRFGRIVDGTPELSVLLDDPTADGAARAGLVERLLDGRAHPMTVELLMDLARDAGVRSFHAGVRELIDQAALRSDKIVAVVHSAIELTAAEFDRLVAGLQRIYSRPMAVHVLVDPKLGGGLRVRVGDEVIDGSMAGRLADLRRRMAG